MVRAHTHGHSPAATIELPKVSFEKIEEDERNNSLFTLSSRAGVQYSVYGCELCCAEPCWLVVWLTCVLGQIIETMTMSLRDQSIIFGISVCPPICICAGHMADCEHRTGGKRSRSPGGI
jgi:hypothetical protein